MAVTVTTYPVSAKGFIGIFDSAASLPEMAEGDYAIVNNQLALQQDGELVILDFKGTIISGQEISNPEENDLVAEADNSSATTTPFDISYKKYDGSDWEEYLGPVVNLIVKRDGEE